MQCFELCWFLHCGDEKRVLFELCGVIKQTDLNYAGTTVLSLPQNVSPVWKSFWLVGNE